MRRKWTIFFAIAGAILPWFWVNANGFGFDGIAVLFPLLVPASILFIEGSKQEPLVWEASAFIFPFLSVVNAALYALVGFLIGHWRFTRLLRSGTVK